MVPSCSLHSTPVVGSVMMKEQMDDLRPAVADVLVRAQHVDGMQLYPKWNKSVVFYTKKSSASKMRAEFTTGLCVNDN